MSTQTLVPPPTHVGTLGAKVARTALAVLLFLQAAVLAMWALSWASDELSEHGLLHVSYPAWAGAALWVILFGAAVRATLVAGLALWQTAWGSPGQIGAKKVNAAWTAVVVNGALVPGLALVATIAGDTIAEAADLANLFWFMLWGGAIAAWLAFFALRPPLRWVGWASVTKALVACAILLIGAGIMFQDQRVGFADSLRSYFFPGPTASAACPGPPDESCAARAARQAGSEIAWVPAPTGYGLNGRNGSIEVRGSQAVETLRSSTDGALLRLSTDAANPNPCGGACPHTRRIRVEHRTVAVHWGFLQGTGYVAVANWSHGDLRFSLSTGNPDRSVDLRWFGDVLRSVRYAGS